MNGIVIPSAFIAAIAMGIPGAAAAAPEAVEMGGLGGVHPLWSTITPPAGAQKCGTGCTQIKYDNATAQSAETALNAFMATSPTGDTIYTYSTSTDAALAYLQAHPNDPNTWILIGSPDTPLNGHNTGQFNLTGAAYRNVTFVVRQYDTVADYPAIANPAAQVNTSLGIHVNGYDFLNLTKPAANYVDPNTGATVAYFATEPLPSIIPTGLPAQNTAQDKAHRAAIEAAYTRPPIPVKYPDGSTSTPPTSYTGPS